MGLYGNRSFHPAFNSGRTKVMNDLHGADLDAFAALNAFILIHFGEELGNLDCLDRANFFAFFTADAAGSAGGAYASAAVVAGAGDIYLSLIHISEPTRPY